jgi:hypothetical protein
MTVPSNLHSTRFSPIASSKPAEKPAGSAGSASSAGTAQARGTTTPSHPSMPAGLVGHHVNTTA